MSPPSSLQTQEREARLIPLFLLQVVLDNGSVLAAGSPEELKAASVFSEDALADSGADDDHAAKVDSKEAEKGTLEEVVADAGDVDAEEAKKAQDKKDSKKLVKDETTSQGGVSLDVYKLYIGAMGTLVFWIVLVALFFGSQRSVASRSSTILLIFR